MRVSRIAALTFAAVLVPACIAATDDTDDDTGAVAEDVHGPGSLANMQPGPCSAACLAAAAGQCNDWRAECADDYPDDLNVECPGATLTCRAAQYAALDTPFGVMACYRSCEGLH